MNSSRLQHSEQGYLRALQISGAKLFVFVEGGLDRPFIERILDRCIGGSPFSVRAAKELPGEAGGKATLLRWHEELSSRGQLLSDRLGKKMAVLFVMDKDADDVLGIDLNCGHVIYTPTYDIEGHLLSCGNLTHAIADAAGITRVQALTVMPNFSEWSRQIARHWIDWMTLCLISHSYRVNCGFSFKRKKSDINPDPLDSPNAAKLSAAKQLLQEKLALPQETFEALYRENRSLIEESIQNHGAFHLFKGKWAESLIERHCKSYSIADANWDALGSRVLSNLLGQADVPGLCKCQDPFVGPIRRIAEIVA